MKNLFTKTTIVVLMLVFCAHSAIVAQGSTSVSGTVTDSETDDTLVGVNVYVKGTVKGTITGHQWQF